MPSRDVAERGESACPPDDRRPCHRFPRSHRLTARRQFLAIYSRGRRARSASMTLFAIRNQLGHCRIGITVTRKVGPAVRRNRAKRVIREIYRRNHTTLKPDMDIVINAHPGMTERATDELEREFLKTFARLARRMAR